MFSFNTPNRKIHLFSSNVLLLSLKLFGPLMSLLARGSARRQLEESFEKLRQLCEGDAG